MATPGSEPAEPQSQTTLPRSSSAQKLGVLQPDPATVGDEPLSGYRLFDIRQLVEFVEQFPCPTCQHSGYDVTEFGAGLATTVRFTCRACSAVVNLKSTCDENINLRFQMAVYSIGGHYMHGQR